MIGTLKKFRLCDLNMKEITVSDVLNSDITVYPIEEASDQYDAEGRDGYFDDDVVYKKRKIKLEFIWQPSGDVSFAMMKHEFYSAYNSKRPFYLVDEMTKLRYLVKLSGDIKGIEHDEFSDLLHSVEMTAYTIRLPFAESLGTTQDIITNGLQYTSDLWSFNMGLGRPDSSYVYKGTQTKGYKFNIYNPSTAKVQHFEGDLLIRLENFANIVSGYGIKIENLTNGTLMHLKDTISSTDIVEQRKFNIFKNNVNAFNKTTYDFLELEPGDNQIVISGADAMVTFIFRFYFL